MGRTGNKISAASKSRRKGLGFAAAAVNDDEWIRRHFQELVDHYPGQYAVVMNGELFVGQEASKLFEQARRKYPGLVPTGIPVPRPQDFLCAL